MLDWITMRLPHEKYFAKPPACNLLPPKSSRVPSNTIWWNVQTPIKSVATVFRSLTMATVITCAKSMSFNAWSVHKLDGFLSSNETLHLLPKILISQAVTKLTTNHEDRMKESQYVEEGVSPSSAYGFVARSWEALITHKKIDHEDCEAQGEDDPRNGVDGLGNSDWVRRAVLQWVLQ